MLNQIVEYLGIEENIDDGLETIKLSFNEEMAVTFSIVADKYLLLEFDAGDVVENKDGNQYVFNELAQICFGGYYYCPAYVYIDILSKSYVLTSKLYLNKFTQQERTDYIDTFLTLCDNVRQRYMEVTLKMLF